MPNASARAAPKYLSPAKTIDDDASSVEIATAAGDSRLRIVATSCLEHAHYYRGEYEQVVDIATENLAALSNESALEYFGMAIPPSIFTRGWMVMSLVELGRFSEV